MEKRWTTSGHCDGDKIPKEMHAEIIQQVEAVEQMRTWYPRLRIRTRIKSQFCYVELIEPDGSFSPLFRLRYFKHFGWSMAFYVWGGGRYLACALGESDFGTLEYAIGAGIHSCEFLHLT
jgi:hypothetical protein